ncbi:SH3 domain-containing protein, partial [Paeniglutamicibacter sp. ORCA_105]|uniref:SH3 domain-containing protein n=1 Tax=Paeniglutamicibacter sp. ORCA_105 TaxID=3377336 RepID=UPI0038963724
SGSWTRVLVSGKTGFVPASSLGASNPSNVYRWVKGKQPVYQAAKTSGTKIGTLTNNTRVQWLRTSGSWQQVRTGAGIGWIQSSKLSTTAIKVIPPKTTVTFSTPRWTTANLNLRSGAGTGYRSVAVVPKGERVLLGRSSGGWANVKTSKGTGWISAGYLSTVAPKPPVVKPNPPKPDLVTFSAPRWTTANLNLRSGAGTGYRSVSVVPKGERVLLGRSSGGWANVKTSKGTGWVSVIYLSTVAPPPPVTTEYRWAAGNVNLRAGNSTVYPIMGLVPAGERVTYLQTKSGWARVVTSRGTGWMSEDYLSTKAVATLQPDTTAVNAAVKQRYAGYVSAYGGVRAGSVGHSSGVATDLMIKDYKSAQGIRNGDEIARFLIANRESLGIYYLIWKDKIWLGPAKGWEEYSKSGKYGNQFVNNWNDTTRHLDHIHAETYGNSGTGAPLVK